MQSTEYPVFVKAFLKPVLPKSLLILQERETLIIDVTTIDAVDI